MGQTESYLLCATPRTGSTLLCSLLKSTGVAGVPESYFREPDEQMWAERWDIVRPNGTIDATDYIRATREAGSTDNGVFAARIMWGSMESVVDKLRAVYQGQVGEVELLEHAFGRMRFLYLYRENVIAQAVSWFRAEQTNVWHLNEALDATSPYHRPVFEFDGIHELVQTIMAHNRAWLDWFASVGVEPYVIRYEDLDHDPVGVTRAVLDFLKLELPADANISANNRRLADELNAEWIGRYNATL